MDAAVWVAIVAAGYLVGSIPSAYLVGKYWGRVDLLKQGDGHVSATAVYREVGARAFTVALLADCAKGLAAVYGAGLVVGTTQSMAAAGLAALAGHCWSVYLGFRGGLGGVVTFTVLGVLMPLPFIIAGVTGGLVTLIFRRSSLGTYVTLLAASTVALLLDRPLVLLIAPLLMLAVQLLKRWQMSAKPAPADYQQNLFYDLRRLRKGG